jgi:protein kinase/serine/threonine-protein kinase
VLVTRNDEAVGLAEGTVLCDATEFELALEEGDRERAVERYGGPLLEGLFLRDTPEFEWWQETERERLARRYGEALEALAGAATDGGDHRQAVEWWRRFATVDRYSSRAALGLMFALEAAGDRAAALQHAQAYAACLKEDLDAEPDPAVTALAERLRREQPPNGVVVSAAADRGPELGVSEGPSSRGGPRRWKVLTLPVVLVLLATFGWRFLDRAAQPEVWPPGLDLERSIAVMPFDNLNGDSSDEYFGRGISEDIAIQLYTLDSVRVVAPSMVARFATPDQDLTELGQLLGVGRILRGTVRRQQDRIRITAQLMDSRTGEMEWGESYDREVADVFDLQADIAMRIAQSLQLALVASALTRPTDPPTASVTAYDYYLQGRDRYFGVTVDGVESAIQFFRKAIELDPQFALAWAWLGHAMAGLATMQVEWDTPGSRGWADSALAAAGWAMALDQDLAETYHALALAYGVKGRKGDAREAYRSAIELEPSHWAATNNLAVNLEDAGQLDRAVVLALRAYSLAPLPLKGVGAMVLGIAYQALDDLPEAERWMTLGTQLRPEDPNTWGNFAWVHLAQGRFGDARGKAQTALARVMETDGSYRDDKRALVMLGAAGDVALFEGDLKSAEEYYVTAIRLSPSAQWNAAQWGRMHRVSLGVVYLQEGRAQEAQDLLTEAMEYVQDELAQGHEGWQPRYQLAAIHAIRGQKDEAYQWLEQAIDAGWRLYRIALQDPLLENLLADQPFQEMMARVKSEVDSMRALVN